MLTHAIKAFPGHHAHDLLVPCFLLFVSVHHDLRFVLTDLRSAWGDAGRSSPVRRTGRRWTEGGVRWRAFGEAAAS